MASNNGLPVGYQPYYQQNYPQYQQQQQFQPQYQQQPVQQNQFSQQPSNIRWVQGIEGAKSYLVAPNESVPLWDTEAQVIYLKSADASGMPSMKILDYTIRSDESKQKEDMSIYDKFATKDDFALIKDELEKIGNRLNSMNNYKNNRKEYGKNE